MEDWRQRFYSDEVKIEIGLAGGMNRVWRKPGTEMQDRYLRASFKGERVSAMFWAAIGSGRRSSLLHIWQRPPAEYCQPNDHGGMDSQQYCKEVLTLGFLPLWNEVGESAGGFSLVEDGSHLQISAYSLDLNSSIISSALTGQNTALTLTLSKMSGVL